MVGARGEHGAKAPSCHATYRRIMLQHTVAPWIADNAAAAVGRAGAKGEEPHRTRRDAILPFSRFSVEFLFLYRPVKLSRILVLAGAVVGCVEQA